MRTASSRIKEGPALNRIWTFGLLFWIGASVLGFAFFVGWFAVSGSSDGQQATETFYLLYVHVFSASSGSFEGDYSAAHLPATGAVYASATVLVSAGIAVASVVGLLAIVRVYQGRTRLILGLALLAVILSILGPSLVALQQSAAVCSDERGFPPPLGSPPNGSASSAGCTWAFYLGGGVWFGPGQPQGPESSFSGQSSQYGSNLTWGPGAGWYLPLAAGGVMALATLFHPGFRTSRASSLETK